jgi:SAM-dependent methyltransferase
VGRIIRPELLDAQAGLDPLELERSLREVWQVNRWLGGNALLLYHLERLLGAGGGALAGRGAGGMGAGAPAGTSAGAPAGQDDASGGAGSRPVRLLDVATGSADIPVALLRWGRRRGLSLTVTAVDLNPQMVELARRRTAGVAAVRVEQADGRCLPYPDRSYDVALCNLALHHMDPGGAVLLLREMARVSRFGWVVGDLERHPAAYWAARALAAVAWRSPLTRHDGPLSVLRSFTAPEAEQLIGQAGVRAAVWRHFPFRLALVGQGEPRG